MKITIERLLQDIDKYQIGTRIELSGTIYTARDQAHKRLVELIQQKKQLPINLETLAYIIVVLVRMVQNKL